MFGRILKHEWVVLRRETTPWVLTALLAALVGYALFSAARWVAFQESAIDAVFEEESGRLERLRTELQEIEAGSRQPSRNADPGNPEAAGSRLAIRSAVHPPSPLAVLAVGQSDLYPYYLKVSTGSRETILAATEIENPDRLLTGRFDLAFVIVYLYPLFVIALGYNLISGERENGTFSLVASQPVPLRRVVAAKVALRLLLSLGLILALSLTGMALAGVEIATPDSAVRLLLWFAVVSAYGLFWFALAALVDLRSRSSAASAVVLSGAWLLLTVVVPSSVQLAVSAYYPVPSRVEMIQATRRASAAAATASSQLLARYYEDHPELVSDIGEADLEDFTMLAFARREDIERQVRPMVDEYESQLGRQQTLVDRLRFLSPAIVTQAALEDLVGRGHRSHRRFLAAVDGFHRQWRGFFAERTFRKERLTADAYSGIPRFAFAAEPLVESAGAVAPGLGMLIGLAALMGIFGLRGAGRRPFEQGGGEEVG